MGNDKYIRCKFKQEEFAQDCPFYGRGARCGWNCIDPAQCPRYGCPEYEAESTESAFTSICTGNCYEVKNG